MSDLLKAMRRAEATLERAKTALSQAEADRDGDAVVIVLASTPVLATYATHRAAQHKLLDRMLDRLAAQADPEAV